MTWLSTAWDAMSGKTTVEIFKKAGDNLSNVKQYVTWTDGISNTLSVDSATVVKYDKEFLVWTGGIFKDDFSKLAPYILQNEQFRRRFKSSDLRFPVVAGLPSYCDGLWFAVNYARQYVPEIMLQKYRDRQGVKSTVITELTKDNHGNELVKESLVMDDQSGSGFSVLPILLILGLWLFLRRSKKRS